MRRTLNRVSLTTLAVLGGFYILHAMFEPGDLITLLNGVFAGSIVAVCITYRRLVYNAVRGLGPYDRYRQMTLGIVTLWLAVSLGVMASIYVKVTEFDPNAFTIVALGRYLAILAALLQVTTPDYGLGVFHGIERRSLYVGIAIGIVVAIATILLQGA